MTEIAPISHTLPARLNSLPVLGDQLRQFLAPLQLAESWIFMLDLALCEAATNIIRHGYEQNIDKSYTVTFALEQEAVVVSLRDGGEPIPPEQLEAASKEPAPGEETIEQLSESGRGLRLMFDCVDGVHYRQERQENILTLMKHLPTEP